MSLLFVLTVFVVTSANILNEEIIDGSNEFGFDLQHELYEDDYLDGVLSNIWISPFCITSCFALIYPGTSTDSTTQIQISSVLGYPSDITPSDITQYFLELQASTEASYNGTLQIYERRDNTGYNESIIGNRSSIIAIANKIYVSHNIHLKQTYIDAVTYNDEQFIKYDFDFTALNATTIINEWVSINTNGLIDEIIDENTDISDWKLAALNAIYLNGTFIHPFIPEMTSLSTFYCDESRQTEIADIHLMHQIEYFDYYNDGNYQYLKFDFQDWENDLFLLFVLPINDKVYEENNGLILDDEVIKSAVTKLHLTRIALVLPKISIEVKYELNEYLKALGMTDAFDPFLADFNEMANESLMIDVVIHKTMVEMDEYGLIAAAVTIIGMRYTGIPGSDEPILFRADHPFQIFIIDGAHNNNILFMGQVINPGIPEGSQDPQFNESIGDIWSNYESYRSEISSTEQPITTESNSGCKLCLFSVVCMIMFRLLQL